MQLIDNLKWRYATKKYDDSKTVSEEDIDRIKEAVQLSASSYGLQLFTVLDVRDVALRKKLRAASWGQSPITDASHVFVFCNYSDVLESHIEEFVAIKSEVQGVSQESLAPYAGFIKTKLSEKSVGEKQHWTSRQTYIALSNALSACAELKIDSTPMEGFDPKAYDEILGLSEKGLQAAVVLAIGYRSIEDSNQHMTKVRKPISSLFVEM